MEKHLSDILKKEAEEKGACGEYLAMDWEKWDMEETIAKYDEIIDFAMGSSFPSVEVLKNQVHPSFLEMNNIHVNGYHNEPHARKKHYFLGNAVGDFSVESFNSCHIVCGYKTTVNLFMHPMSRGHLDVYGEATVNIKSMRSAKLYVVKHGDKCNVFIEGNGQVLVREGGGK